MIDAVLTPGPRAELAARIADDLDARTSAFERAAKHVARGGDEDAIHDLRVASRRLGEGLGVWRAFLEPGPAREARHGLRRVRKRMGTGRDAEVRFTTFASLASRGDLANAALYEIILGRLARRRRRARERAARVARPGRMARLIETVEAARKPMFERLARLADPMRDPRARVERRREHSDAALARAVGSEDPSVLHATRIAVKKDRYAAECLDAVIGGVDASRIARLRALQQALGAVQDGVVAASWLERLEQKAVARGRLASASALATLRAAIEDDRRTALARFAQALDVGPRAVPAPPAPDVPEAALEVPSAGEPPTSPDERLPETPPEARSLLPDA